MSSAKKKTAKEAKHTKTLNRVFPEAILDVIAPTGKKTLLVLTQRGSDTLIDEVIKYQGKEYIPSLDQNDIERYRDMFYFPTSISSVEEGKILPLRKEVNEEVNIPT